MNFIEHTFKGKRIAEVELDEPTISSTEEGVDLLGNLYFNGFEAVILRHDQLHPDFFELRSGLAGDILQKFSNYRMKLAIVGHFQEVKSNALRDFIRESNRTGQIAFVSSIEEGLEQLG